MPAASKGAWAGAVSPAPDRGAAELSMSTLSTRSETPADRILGGEDPRGQAVRPPREGGQVSDEERRPRAWVRSHAVVPALDVDLLEADASIEPVRRAAAAYGQLALQGLGALEGDDPGRTTAQQVGQRGPGPVLGLLGGALGSEDQEREEIGPGAGGVRVCLPLPDLLDLSLDGAKVHFGAHSLRHLLSGLPVSRTAASGPRSPRGSLPGTVGPCSSRHPGSP